MPEPTKSEPQTTPAERILIVEDEANARQGYEALLRKWGYEVLGVGSAEDALARFAEFAPEALIADVELPGMNGLELLERLHDELAQIPAILITGKGSEERVVAAIAIAAKIGIHRSTTLRANRRASALRAIRISLFIRISPAI